VLCHRSLHVLTLWCVGPNSAPTYFLATPLEKRKNKSVAMTVIPKSGEVDAANIWRPNVQQLLAEHQKILDDIQKNIREEKEKEIQRQAMNQYISHFVIDRQGKVTTDAAFDASQFEEAPAKKVPEDSLKNSTLGGQEQKKGARSAQTGLTGLETGLTGRSGISGKNSRNKKEKERPSFKELLAKYENKGVVQKQRERPDKVKDTNPSSSQEQSSLSQGNSFNGPIAPWYCWYPCYMPLDYSRMHMQSYYIHYPPIYSSFASQRPISDNLAKKNIDCSKECEKNIKQDSKYLQPKWCPSGLSHTQKRRLQRMRKKESMEQQAEVIPTRSTTMKQVWKPKQVVSSST